MKQNNHIKIFSFVLAALLLFLFITQLLPFWNCSDCKTHPEGDKMISVAEYILFPLDHKTVANNMTEAYKAIYGEDLRDAQGQKWVFTVDEILTFPLLVFVGCLLGIVLCIVMENKLYGLFSGTIAGISGVVGYLMYLPLQWGANWQLHLIAAVIVTIVAAPALVYTIVFKIKHNLAKNK